MHIIAVLNPGLTLSLSRPESVMLNYFLHAIGYVGAASLRRGLVLMVPVPDRPSVRPNDTVTLLS
jgi:hypothetical protein